ncbi:MAG: hypothetical protein CMN85_12625 [Spongiibacteraceae bacterium]|nr:hypothetical protein [Spongiibacteraceae bacterium]
MYASWQEDNYLDHDLPLGRYQHYKGGEYDIIGVARHSETDERVVVYRPLYGEGALWVRPLDMFLETVVVAGEVIPRFRLISDR